MNIDMALEIGLYATFYTLISFSIGLVVLAIIWLIWYWLPEKVEEKLEDNGADICVGFIFPMN